MFHSNSCHINYIPTTVSPPSLISPRSTLPLCFPSETSRSPKDINQAWHNVLHKSRDISSHQRWTRWPSRRERVPQACKRIRNISTPSVRSPSRTPSDSVICKESRKDCHRLPDLCENPWIPVSGFCRSYSYGVPDPSCSSEPSFHDSAGFQSSCFDCGILHLLPLLAGWSARFQLQYTLQVRQTAGQRFCKRVINYLKSSNWWLS